MERVLGEKLTVTYSGSHKTTYDCCYDVPFLSSLQLLLNDKEIQKEVRICSFYANATSI